jgi:hypothetical protein
MFVFPQARRDLTAFKTVISRKRFSEKTKKTRIASFLPARE